VLSFFTEGEHMIEFLNDLPMTADAVGNHEFDYGVEVAEERFADSEFPWLSANVLTPDDEPIPGTERWMTTEIRGIPSESSVLPRVTRTPLRRFPRSTPSSIQWRPLKRRSMI
jgi:2',3'-cyclic-nucleotide 2'-phosphodiesterase (5'-nucleotidase family)